MLHTKKSFTVPATGEKSKKPCAVHHFVKGKCLRCDERIQMVKPQELNAAEGKE